MDWMEDAFRVLLVSKTRKRSPERSPMGILLDSRATSRMTSHQSVDKVQAFRQCVVCESTTVTCAAESEETRTSTRAPPLLTASGPPESPLHVPTGRLPLAPAVHSVDAVMMPPKNCAHATFVITCSETWLWNWLCEMPAAVTKQGDHYTMLHDCVQMYS